LTIVLFIATGVLFGSGFTLWKTEEQNILTGHDQTTEYGTVHNEAVPLNVVRKKYGALEAAEREFDDEL
jgi:hypothetical protein